MVVYINVFELRDELGSLLHEEAHGLKVITVGQKVLIELELDVVGKSLKPKSAT